MSQMKIVSNVAELNSLQNVSDGDLILVDNDKQVYCCKNGELTPISSDANLNLSLYDLNKNIIFFDKFFLHFSKSFKRPESKYRFTDNIFFIDILW